MHLLLQVTFHLEEINITCDTVRTSHRRANKNRKTLKWLTLQETYCTPRTDMVSRHVILDCAGAEWEE